jgi:Enoyl-CoA hydratase/carnithine racemase
MTTTSDLKSAGAGRMDLETLELQVHDKTAVVVLNRPPVNALNRKLFEELHRLMDWIDHNRDVKAVVITGKGDRAFAAGADIGEMAGLDAGGMDQMNRISRAAFERVEHLTKPVIAAVNGSALGGGCELALCCDFRIASENAKFALPEINLGIIPGGGGTQRLPRLIGQAKAKELLYFGDLIGAEDARAIGLVNKVVPLEQLLDAALEWAHKLADKPAVAMRMLKAAVNRGAGMDFSSALSYEAACFGTVFATEDRAEGMRSFVEKRKPVYKDR